MPDRLQKYAVCVTIRQIKSGLMPAFYLQFDYFLTSVLYIFSVLVRPFCTNARTS